MHRFKVTYLILTPFFFLIFNKLQAQDTTFFHKKFFAAVTDTLQVDTLPLVPNSVKILRNNKSLQDSFKVIWYKSLIIFKHQTDSVTIIYRTFPFQLPKTQPQHVTLLPLPMQIAGEQLPKPNFDNGSNIQTMGKISRGISFGTNTEPTLTSNLSLRLSGQLTDKIKIEAVIADNTLGQSQMAQTYSLQDFDRSQINVYFPNSKLSAGDIRINQNLGPFVRYERAIKGLMFNYADSSSTISLGLGVQKGTFRRQKFMGQDANQGPYRLTGNNNEEFIVIISGSERVYVDGQIKQRGRDKDYLIDYSRAEITFTANCPITKDSRIIVEFEYWTTKFAKSTMLLSYSQNIEQVKLYAGFLRTGNNPASAATFFNKEQLLFLAKLGDSTQNALWDAADSVGSGKGMYCKRDTVWNGKVYKIYVYAKGAKCAAWNVSFSYVGHGHGDYMLDYSNTNDRIFRWIGPNLGSYVAEKKLQAPSRKQAIVIGGNWETKGWNVGANLTFGHKDLNLFSSLDDEDDNSLSYNLSLQKDIALNFFCFDSLILNASYNKISKRLPRFNRFLPVEFDRDWDIDKISGDLQLFDFKATAIGKNRNISLNGQKLIFQDYNGQKFDASYNQNSKKWLADIWTSYNSSKSYSRDANFLRSHQVLAYKLGKMQIGWNFDGEKNIFQADSLLSSSYAFAQGGIFWTYGDSINTLLKISLTQRQDFTTENQKLIHTYTTNTAAIGWSKNTNVFTQNLKLIYRQLTTPDDSKNNIILQNNSNLRISRWLIFNTFLQSQNGSQPILEFHFVQVPTGSGQYEWIDFNKDGKQQIDEFQITNFPDKARYIKITLPSNHYIHVIDNKLNLSLNLQPFVAKSSFLYKIINKFSDNLALNLEQKNTHGFLSIQSSDTNNVFHNYQVINRLNFKLTENTALLLISQWLDNKNLLLGGYQAQFQRQNSLNFKITPTINSTIIAQVLSGKQKMKSQLFAQNNYEFSNLGANLQYTVTQNINSISLNSKILRKTTLSNIKLRTIELNVTLNKHLHNNTNVSASIKYINNKLIGTTGNLLNYVLMNGFGQGNNIDASLTATVELIKNLVLNVTYTLRLTNSHAVQLINFQVTGLF